MDGQSCKKHWALCVTKSIAICVLFLGFLTESTKAEAEPSHVLTVKQMIDIFGTNSSLELPPVEYVRIQRATKREPNTLQYRLKLNGEDVILTLKQNTELLTQGCVVHHYKADGFKKLYPCARGIANCFYTGGSDSHPGSWAAVNTCHGLKGVINIRNNSHVVAPLNRKRLGHSDDYNDTHVVYRYTGNKAMCKTQELLQSIKTRTETRTKRSGGQATRYIEASVVIDPSVYDMYSNDQAETNSGMNAGMNAEEYIQTTFNVASKLYEDKSIGEDIRLCLSEMHIYESYNNISIPFTTDAQKTLDDFCDWHSQVTKTSPDCTVIYTRINLAYNNDSSTVGLARQSQMCRQGRNCAIVQDVGPASGLTIAHEIGHLLGMKHDGTTPCNDTPGVMAVGASGPAAFRWSTCSAQALNDFLRTSPNAQCLNNKPASSTYAIGYNISVPLPGTLYSRDEQCQLIMASRQASYCYDKVPELVKNGTICGELWCRKNATAPCATLSQTLDGSDCDNTRSWCISSKCVAMDTTYNVPPVDGTWSAWDKSYSPCTQMCGGGVKVKRRTCTNPRPRYGGKPCVGISLKTAICNMQACSANYDYREQQCARLDTQYDWTKYGHWHYRPGQKGNCAMQCQATKGISRYGAPRGWYFSDGTECESGPNVPFGKCVDKQCRRYGCDGIMDSGLKYDRCGVCNGTGTECRRVFGRYSSMDGAIRKFIMVMGVPRGSYGVSIKQRNPFCFLSVLVNGKRIINPDAWTQSLSGTYTEQGTSIRYQRHPESIHISGPTKSSVEIQVYRKFNLRPDVSYEYYVRMTIVATVYQWSKRWAPCTKSCGTGYEIPTVQCEDLSQQGVADYHCDLYKKPNENRRRCNTHACPPQWRVSELGPCSVTCGPGGIRTQKVHCVRDNSDENLVYGCDQALRPASQISCTLVKCIGVWRTGQWSQCSKTCSEGFQTREVRCYNPDSDAPSAYCSQATRPPSSQTCTHGFCPVPYNHSPDCRDVIPNCKHSYGKDICYGNYSRWAEQKCVKQCGICTSDDDPRCKIMDNACHGQYAAWAARHCRNLCRVCVDQPLCQDFVADNKDICKYTSFSKKNCPSMCGFCGPCKDDPAVPCDQYDVKHCHLTYMRTKCRKHCGICY